MSSSEVSSGEDSEPPSSRNSQKGSEHRTSGGFCRNPKRWNFGNLIGEGAYGKVKEIIDTRSKKLYAVKILTQKKLRNIPGGSDSILREIRIMQKIDHKNCIQFVDYWTDEKKKSFLVLEYVGGGSLQEYLDQSSSNLLSLYQARKLFKQLMKALKHIHGLGIVHRDVKPDNIMLDSKKSKLKLSDFGIAYCPAEKGNNTPSDEEADNPRKRCYGSPAYQSPEVTSGKGPAFHPAVDVWAAGIILYQMCFGKYPFQIASSDVLKNSNKGLKETLNGLCQCKMNIPEGTDPQLCNLLKGMLEVDPQKRLTVSQVRSSSWMKMKIKKTKHSEMVPIRSSCSREVRSSFLGTSTKFVKCNFVASKRER